MARAGQVVQEEYRVGYVGPQGGGWVAPLVLQVGLERVDRFCQRGWEGCAECRYPRSGSSHASTVPARVLRGKPPRRALAGFRPGRATHPTKPLERAHPTKPLERAR
ncbi:hypothetical protein GCM10009539_79000 [Cryptosporangium japonicum]|uniref:Uncharacterized protein n=1 Tax=Cryptosporangium japonicum TaxID=80872 RepID=A0ABN0V8K9_9ACTN